MTIRSLVVALLAATTLAPTAVWAGPPTEQLRRYTDAIIRVLEDPTLKAESRRGDRREAVRKLAADVFDVHETARRALGIHWQARSAEEREEFTQLFADLLERTYISQIDHFGGERIRFISEQIDGDVAIVKARVLARGGGLEVPVEGRLLKRGDRWLVYDISVENISLISNYRAQFDKIIRTSSYEDLVRRLRAKQVEFHEGGPRKGA